jgi:hypothetical protein
LARFYIQAAKEKAEGKRKSKLREHREVFLPD